MTLLPSQEEARARKMGPEWILKFLDLQFDGIYHADEAVEHIKATNSIALKDPFGEKRGHFDYQSLIIRLQAIHQKVQEKHQQENLDIDSDSSSSETETDTQGSTKL